jgi:sulfite reductase alpha subunit-like flavoprotein
MSDQKSNNVYEHLKVDKADAAKKRPIGEYLEKYRKNQDSANQFIQLLNIPKSEVKDIPLGNDAAYIPKLSYQQQAQMFQSNELIKFMATHKTMKPVRQIYQRVQVDGESVVQYIQNNYLNNLFNRSSKSSMLQAMLAGVLII